MKRAEYLSWDEYFMGIALLSAQRSKDPARRWGLASSVRIIRFCPWGITVCPPAVATM